MSFFLRIADKIKGLISPNALPRAENYLKNNKTDEPKQFNKSQTTHHQKTTFKKYKSNIPEHMKYVKVKKLVKDYVVLDFETTGLRPNDSGITQIGAVKYKDHKVIDQYSTLINPQTSISSRITQLTGITYEDVKDAPTIEEELPKLIEFIEGNHLVAHNASFDLKFLLHNMHNYKIPHKKFRVIDTLSLARKHILTENHKLVTLKNHFKLNKYKSHSALDDCFVTGEVYKHCYELEINPPPLVFGDVSEYNNVIELYDIGESLYRNKQLEDAEKYLLASIDKGNDAPAVFERLAIMYRKQKRYQDEIDICELAKEKVSDSQDDYRDEMFNKRIKRAKQIM